MTRDEEAANPGRYLHILYAARFRRPEDRRRLSQLYRRFFEPLYPLGGQDGMLRQEDEVAAVGVGEFCVRRGACQLEGRGERLALLERQRPLLESMAGCIHHSWPVILTGTIPLTAAHALWYSLVQKFFFFLFLCKEAHRVSLLSSKNNLDER